MTTTTTLRDRVFDTILGYRDAETIIAHANTASPHAIPDEKEARAAIFGRVRAAILADEPIPDTIADDLAAIDRARQTHAAVNDIIGQVTHDARQTIDAALPILHDDAYRLLNTELQSLVTAVSEVIPNLAGATTASEAVANGGDAVDAWRAIHQYTETYDEIRTVQHNILPRGDQYFWDRLLTVSLYRDALEAHPYFVERLQGVVFDGWEQHRLPHGRLSLSGEQSWWPADVDRPTALVRIVTTTTPWVPTAAQLETVFSLAVSASAKIGEHDDPRVAPERERRLAAHDEYLARL